MGQDISKLLVKPGSKVNLKKIATRYEGKMQKEQANAELDRLHAEMNEFQYKIHAEKKQALLIVLQAMDAGGKDGTIRDVMYGFNPQGCKVIPFRTPTTMELSHDFLWRVHKAVPAKGEIGIFNRSHYGDILVVKIHNLVPPKQWSKRYDHINDFERMLTDEGTRILKIFLHISKAEQKKRLDKRINNPLKHWKVDESDFKERRYWDKYIEAHQQMLEKCSTAYAPWYVVPSDRKWYRNWAVAQIIIKNLQQMNPKMPKPSIDVTKFKSSS